MKFQIKKKEIFTIPNFLSVFRIALAILFLHVFYKEITHKRFWLCFILLGSALTDFLDGKIARRFNMVTELGKIIDPLADKVTQLVLLLCLLGKYPAVKYVMILFLIKESCMGIFGAFTVLKLKKNDGAKWYGKLSTFVFYLVMLILVLFTEIPVELANTLIGISGICMLIAFVLYMRQYICSENRESINVKKYI